MRIILLLVAVLPFASEVAARTWRVLVDGTGDVPTIQTAIDSAKGGDTVLVSPGRYFENIRIVGKDLVLRSLSGPQVTTLDGSGQEETVVYLSGSTRATVIEGFTVTGGIGHNWEGIYLLGGGFYLDNGASPVVRNNHVFRNGIPGSTDFGGGLVTAAPPNLPESPLISGNLFEDNVSDHGGALYIDYGSSEIRGNIFRNNISRFDGGAVYCVLNAAGGTASITITDNQFWDNSAQDHGGALQIYGQSNAYFQIERNLFVRNTARGIEPGDSGSGGAIHIGSVPASILNNTFVDNVGYGESICGGGAIALQNASSTLVISFNIVAYNRSCGVACYFSAANTLGPNLFWMNEDGDLGAQQAACPSEWSASQIFADPLFCNPATGNYTVSINSPALSTTPMGVWTQPGCGAGVPVRPITWGRLKATYR